MAISVRSVAHHLFPERQAKAVAAPEAATTTAAPAKSISRYLIERLHEHGVRHLFGIPGDYSIGFYKAARESGLLDIVNTCDEQGAGFAADAYARTRGLAAVCFTYAVGGLKAINTTAEAYAEKSPVVVIGGAPGVGERSHGPWLHHVVKDFDTQRKVFEQVTVACTLLDNPTTAFAEIDRVLDAALRCKRPVYIEIPRDLFSAPGEPNHVPMEFHPTASNPQALAQALKEATELINQAERPVILVDVEVVRFGLEHALREFVERNRIPFATTVLAKGTLSERHPACLGVYQGAIGHPDIRKYVEASDCLIMLGPMLTDLNMGLFTATIDLDRAIYVSTERVSIRHHAFSQVTLSDFVEGLRSAPLRSRADASHPRPAAPAPFEAEAGKALTVARLGQAINAFIDDNTAIIGDTGESLFTSGDLLIHGEAEYYAPSYYSSVGFSVPAAIGAQLGDPEHRPLTITGDGSFQMTGVELSTIVRSKLNPIVLVLNNGGYGTERPLDDAPYVELQQWNYAKIPEVLQAGHSFTVRTEDQLATALSEARAITDSFSLLDIYLDRNDRSPAFERFLALFAKGVK